MTPAIAELPTDALATVEQLRCTTLPHPAEMTNDELSHVVKKAFARLREYLPWIEELKGRFTDGERDSKNHLKTPIDGCDSWKEYCTSILSRTPQAISKALGSAKLKNLGSRLTGVDVAEYEREHPDIRQFARNLLTQMSESDAVSVLVNQGTPEPVAEILVRLVAAEKLASPEPEPISNRELRRQAFVTEHPEYKGKSNPEIDKAIHETSFGETPYQENPFDLTKYFVEHGVLGVRVRPVSNENELRGDAGNFIGRFYNRTPDQLRRIADILSNHPEIGTGGDGEPIFAEQGDDDV